MIDPNEWSVVKTNLLFWREEKGADGNCFSLLIDVWTAEDRNNGKLEEKGKLKTKKSNSSSFTPLMCLIFVRRLFICFLVSARQCFLIFRGQTQGSRRWQEMHVEITSVASCSLKYINDKFYSILLPGSPLFISLKLNFLPSS